jgi:hypothetical protein
MENVMTSTPLYEKIVVDRKEMNLQGFTFEKASDQKHSEHYTYQQNLADGSINYEMDLFREPGLKRLIRGKLHALGVESLTKLISVQQKL